MKKLFIIFFAAVSCCFLHAQNVGIGNTKPNANATMDLQAQLVAC